MKLKRREVVFFRDRFGKEPANRWLAGLGDARAKVTVFARVRRASEGNFGEYRSVGEGVYELKISFGPGYRVYFAIGDADTTIYLLVGGDKSTQSRDIIRAKSFWAERKGEKNG